MRICRLCPAEVGEGSERLHARVLNDIRRVHLAGKPGVELHPGEEGEVIAVILQQLPQGVRVAGTGLEQKGGGGGKGGVGHGNA